MRYFALLSMTSGNTLALPVRGSQEESYHAECNEASRPGTLDPSLTLRMTSGWGSLLRLMPTRADKSAPTDEIKGERRDMTDTPSSVSNNRPHLQAELFRPSLQYPSHSYAEILSKTAERYPENEAVIFSLPIHPVTDPRQNGNKKDVNLTYRELDALVNAFANALLNLGIQKGDRVCLLMTNRPEFIISWFALARIGAIISPMNPSYKEREVAYQLSNCEAVAIVVQHELLSLIEKVRAQTPTLKHIIVVDDEHQLLLSHMHSFRQMVCAYASTPPISPA